MRFYRPSKYSNVDTWCVKRQIVVPKSVRRQIIEIAHDGFGGHLGNYKTYYKILDKFYWPDLRKDVQSFVRTCHICQIAGKPNQTIPKAPLLPIPVPQEPFEKIVIDCVGPLPKSKSGNQYLLTIMCPTTRFPEAIPLRNISAKNIVKNLLKFFTMYGIPKDIQTDRGSNFTSNLFAAVLKELNVKHSMSSAYHPESQGVLERWHQTFKTMLRKFCLEGDSQWDEGIPFLLFAIREAPQESLGVSPFEMLYGRVLRGPLALVRDEWIKSPCPDQTLTVQQYLNTLKDKLARVRNIAKENLKEAQLNMKLKFDSKSKVRKFKSGDLVLAYFPISGSPFQSKFFGPYKVVKNANNNTYVIETPDRKKSTQLIHVNLLKKYYCRDTEDGYRDISVNLNFNVTRPDLDVEKDFVCSWESVDNIQGMKDICYSFQHLFSHQSQELQDLLLSYPDLYSETPGRCSVMKHDIDLHSGTTPIRQHSYRISPAKQQAMKQEVEYLLKNNLAKPSKSPWASPCLLVPKEDGSLRLCTDYRRVNSVTVKDSFPLPRIDDIIDSIGQAKYVTKVDLLKGYYQVELTDKAKTISAFTTPFGLFEYEVMPFGLTNAPSTFQRIINNVIQGLDGVFAYLDDIITVGTTWEDHLYNLDRLFQRLSEAKLTINLKKSSFGQATVSYLGHIVGGGVVRPKTLNVNSILNYPVPTTKKSLKRFLGMVSYYRKFCRNFASVAAPLHHLTSSKERYVWDDKCQLAFENLKCFLSNKPVLKSPDFNKMFFLQVDACDTGLGCVLLQEADDGLHHPVSYSSTKLKKHQLAYSTIEKELLSLVLALQKYECYLHGAPEIVTYTDHNPLVFLDRTKTHNQRLLRWALYLQNFNLKIRHLKGKENVFADALSRVYSSPSSTGEASGS